jgi:hypothetical protein
MLAMVLIMYTVFEDNPIISSADRQIAGSVTQLNASLRTDTSRYAAR